MRMLLFFDLPVETGEDKRNYRRFRKLLITNGFVMMQESVYTKLITTPSVENHIKNVLHKNKPPKGLIQCITITEKQFAKMEFVVGESITDVINNDKRLLIL